jgi:hypothetical protein
MSRHREMLVLSSLIVLLAVVFEVRPDDRVMVHGLANYPLPPTCLSYEWFGIRCPGCGLTRSFVHLAHGNWSASWRTHRLGWLMAAAVLLQFPYRILALTRGGQSPLGTRIPVLFGHLLIALFVGNWLLLLLGPALTSSP